MAAMRRLDPFARLVEFLRVLGTIAAGGRDLRTLSRAAVAPAAGSRARGRIGRVLAWLHEKYTGTVTQAQAAALAGMTASGFSRFFRRAAGTTFVEHLAGLRVAHAADLLVETDLPVVDVSLRAGFSNLSNFNRRFRRMKAMTPREFRRRYAEAAG
jgi:transcriptional regulator GlxA family with amidase domain